MKRLVCGLAGLALLLSNPVPGRSQVDFGVHGSWVDQTFDGSFGLGGRASVDLGWIANGLRLSGTFDNLFPDCPPLTESCAYWEVSGSLLFFSQPGARGFYAGLGGAYQSSEIDNQSVSDEAFNLVAGLRFSAAPVLDPFAEIRFQLFSDDVNQVVISAGLVFSPFPRPSSDGR